MKQRTTTMVTAITVLLTLCGLVLIAIGLRNSVHSSASEGDNLSVTAQTKATLDAYLKDNDEVITAMPEHARSAEVYGKISAMWRDDTQMQPNDVAKSIVVTFRDSPLGLYALSEYETSMVKANPQEVHAFCTHLCDAFPDSRAACMAFDYLLEKDPGSSLNLCTTTSERHGDTRLGIFARIKQGDLLEEQGRQLEATVSWLEAWIRAPSRGAMLCNKLYATLVQQGELSVSILLNAEYQNDPVVNPVKKRILSRLQTPPQGATAEVLKSSCAGSEAMNRGDLHSTADQLLRMADLLSDPAITPPEQADFALAAFLLHYNAQLKAPTKATLGSMLRGRTEFDAARSKLLQVALNALPSLDPDLHALYRLLVANRHLDGNAIQPARQVLNGVWNTKEISPAWREHLLTRYCKILVEEQAQPKTAASTYEQYCDSEPSHSLDSRAQAGLLYYQSEAFNEALTQFKLLGHESNTEYYQALSLFMQGVCCERLCTLDSAEELLKSVLTQFPQTEFAPKSLGLLSTIAIHKGDVEQGTKYIDELTLRYPQSKEVPRYTEIAKKLMAPDA